MFERLCHMMQRVPRNHIFVLLEVTLMSILIYVLLSKQTTLRHIPRLSSPEIRRTVDDDDTATAHTPSTVRRMMASHANNGNYMNCPVGWELAVLERGPDSRAPSQKCRSLNDANDWMCVPGWEKLNHSPFCKLTQELSSAYDTSIIGPEFSQTSSKNKLLFIHIPQAGGLVMEQSHLFDDKRELLNGHYLGGHFSINDFNKELIKPLHKFVIVRHPCSRLYATWKYFSRRLGNSVDNQWVDIYFDDVTSSSFNAFVQKTLRPEGQVDVESEAHLKSQLTPLFDESGQFGLDQVLIFERWNESMDALGELAKLDTSELKQNSEILKDHVDCTKEYTEESWEKMKKLYELDICVLGYSGDLNHASEFPPLTNDAESMTARYKTCKEQLSLENRAEEPRIDRDGLSFIDEITRDDAALENVDPACIVYTYFQEFENKQKAYYEEAREMLRVWKQAWKNAGWVPRIITDKQALSHPDYEELKGKFMELPTVNQRDYELSCFMRYVAMAAVGGGWMTDYDVLPIRLPGCTSPFHNGRLTVHQRFVPALVSGTSEEYTRVAREMADIDWRSDWDIFNYQKERPHVSDMLCLVKLVRDHRVESEHTVSGGNEVFQSPFNCDNAAVRGVYKDSLIAAGFPPLKVAIHYSHSCMKALRSNESVLVDTLDEWSRSTFMTSRANAMEIGNNYFVKNCVT